MVTRTWLFLGVLSSAACGDDPAWVGTWKVNATWDLRGPFSANHTVGDAVAEIVLGKIVGLTPVPSFLEDDLYDLLDAAAGDAIQQAVDDGAPAELGPSGSVTTFLSQTLASVRTTSRLVLDEAVLDDLEGEETLRTLDVDFPGGPETIDIYDSDGDPAEWSGDESGKTFDIEPHYVPLQYGALLAEVLLHLLDAAGLDDLRTGVLAALDCVTVVDTFLGGETGFDVNLGDWTYTIPESDFIDACDAARSSMSNRVLGLFSSDTAVLVGGEFTWKDSDHPTLAGGFSGILDVAPEAVAPRITVMLSGKKR
jgi:hypothetical protein